MSSECPSRNAASPVAIAAQSAAGMLALALASASAASSIVTLDIAAAAAWQAGSHVLGFDAIAGADPYQPGTIVPAGAQITDDYAACARAAFSSEGGPAAAIKVLGSTQQGDAQSLPNILGGTSLGGGNVVINYLSFIEVEFVDEAGEPVFADRVGAWNDPTGSRIRLSAFDDKGRLIEAVEGDQGVFIGIQAPQIARARFQHVQSQGAVGFSLDDVTVGRDTPLSDLNGDGDVDGADLGQLLSGWGRCMNSCCAGDLNLDGVIDGADLGTLLASWTG